MKEDYAPRTNNPGAIKSAIRNFIIRRILVVRRGRGKGNPKRLKARRTAGVAATGPPHRERAGSSPIPMNPSDRFVYNFGTPPRSGWRSAGKSPRREGSLTRVAPALNFRARIISVSSDIKSHHTIALAPNSVRALRCARVHSLNAFAPIQRPSSDQEPAVVLGLRRRLRLGLLVLPADRRGRGRTKRLAAQRVMCIPR